MRRATFVRSAVGCVTVALTLLLTATPASALSKHVFSAAITGSGPTALTNPVGVAVDQSTHDVYVANQPLDQRQAITVDATGGTFTLSFKGQTTAPINYNTTPTGTDGIEGRLELLSTVGQGNVAADTPNGPLHQGGPYTVEFIGALGAAEQPQITADSSGLTGASHSVTISTTQSALPHAEVEKFTPSGQFLYLLGKEVNPTTNADLCAAPEACRPGALGVSPGAFALPSFLALDPTNGDLYVGDTSDDTVTKFDSSGHLQSSWQSAGQLSFAGPLQGIAVDPAGDLFVLDQNQVYRYTSAGSPVGNPFTPEDAEAAAAQFAPFGLAVDREDHLYATLGSKQLPPGYPDKFNSLSGEFLGGEAIESGYVRPHAEALALDPLSNDLYLLESAELDFFNLGSNLHGGQRIRSFGFNCPEFKTKNGCPLLEEFGTQTVPLSGFGSPLLGLGRGLALDSDGTAYVADSARARVAAFASLPVPELATATKATGQTALTLSATVDPGQGGPITECQFEYGETAGEYNLGTLPCDPGTFSGKEEVHAALSGLTPLTTYHYRLLAANSAAGESSGDRTFLIPLPPQLGGESATELTADSATVNAQIIAGGGPATYRVQYLTEAQAKQNEEQGQAEFAATTTTPSLDAGSAQTALARSSHLGGLQPETTYRYRVIVENALEAVTGATHSLTTLSFAPFSDTCPNAHVRQQTSAAQLLDCRAYELVSAANTAGYDVESNLIPGQTPFAGYPQADGRVLYGVHNGGIPGTGYPTNRGVDPYLATRGEDGWSTRYVGVPANATPSGVPFGSPLLEADPGLQTFAFGGQGICSPCFADGSTGTPVHLPDGELVQGIAGSIPQPSAQPAGFIARHLSADGTHFVFGSKSKLEPDANAGEISIYDRNLTTDEAHVVSKTPGGQTMKEEGAEIGELDISKDGSHILIGHLVEESEGTKYWRLYMNVGDSGKTIDLTPGATEGVLFDGMTEDGSKVFFSSAEHLTHEDEEHSGADIFIWSQEGEEEGDPLTLISKGNGNSCDPVANSAHEHWNTAGSEEDCGVVAIGGGGGVSSANGTIYFLSPEKLAGSGNGTENAPNLYVARPTDGYATHFLATLESALTAPHPPKLKHSFDHSFGSFGHAAALAVDHSSGDLYVLDAGTNRIEKFDSSGNPVSFNFPAGSKEAPGNKLLGADTPAESFETSFFGLVFPTELAVDQSSGDFYVPDLAHSVVDKFTSSGEYLSQVEVAEPTAAAVDPATGDLYVASLFGSVFVFDSSGTPISSFPAGEFLASVAVDASATVYVTQLAGFSTGETEIFDSSGKHLGTLDHNPGYSVNVDPSNGDVYVDEGEAIARFDSTGKRLETFGTEGDLSGSVGVTVDPEGNLYATDAGGTEVAVFLPHLAPDPRVDNPAVLDSVSEPQARHTADFQTTPNGDFAAFPSTLALAGAGEEPAGHTEVFRYAVGAEKLDCVSCLFTGATTEGDSGLARQGLSLTDQGQVFFDSTVSLVGSDTDNKRDAYQWEPPGTGNCQASSPTFAHSTSTCRSLISAGTSSFDSSLLSASANGRDVYFFTRDSLAPQDENGSTIKIYDAREGGGFPYSFPPVVCKASDECHGAASPAPPPIQTGSETGAPQTSPAKGHKPCKKGFVKKHRHCIRKPHKRHKRANHNPGGRK
jgi:DNA-binding beta-propeller fold protein YncE